MARHRCSSWSRTMQVDFTLALRSSFILLGLLLPASAPPHHLLQSQLALNVPPLHIPVEPTGLKVAVELRVDVLGGRASCLVMAQLGVAICHLTTPVLARALARHGRVACRMQGGQGRRVERHRVGKATRTDLTRSTRGSPGTGQSWAGGYCKARGPPGWAWTTAGGWR